MKKEKELKVTNPRKSFLFCAELALILLFTFIKSTRFYSYIGLAEYAVAVSFATVALLLAVAVPLLLFTKKNPATVVFWIYTVMCLLMFVDRLYFTYFSSLPGVAKLTLLKYMVGVTDSVGALFSLSHFLFILDLPFCLIYLFFIRKHIAKFFAYSKEQLLLAMRIAVSALCALSTLASAVLIHLNGGYYASLKNELFLYHASDIISTVSPFSAGDDAKAMNYMLRDNEGRHAGIAEGRNLINIQVEALNEFPIGLMYEGQEITPNLNRLLEADTIYFDNYYWCVIGGGGTSDCEFAMNNSLYPPSGEASYDKYTTNDYFGMPFLLKANGYKGAYVFHGFSETFWNRNNAYPFQGFDDYISGEDLKNTETIGLGISDKQFYEQTIDYLVTYEQPFYAFLITLSSHHPFQMPTEFEKLTLKEEHAESMFGDYLQSMHYVDETLGYFLDMLKENGLYDNSVITIYGDHYGLNRNNDDGFTDVVIGETYNNEEIFKIPLFIHIPGSGITETVSTTGSHLDYAPTMLSLLGIENDRSIMFGQNLLKEGITGHVYGQNQMCIGGFITDEIYAELGANGLNVYNKLTNERIEDVSPYQELSDTATQTLADAHYLLDTNQIRMENFQ